MQKQSCSTEDFESHFDFAFFVARQLVKDKSREAPQRPVRLPVLTLANRFIGGRGFGEASRVRRMT
jgi:hypothetical protein